ncbi:hypothetical protein Patl1_27413 [Pistacia atlantica]|uniref:Uncharacterized protein n=1 Tax=Pistacia atlantica TaxID=434234 RepID=A0ACC1BCT7_9ROSI|nr:hypothetical protein Patl1_27413 [Pistacia atlantica]
MQIYGLALKETQHRYQGLTCQRLLYVTLEAKFQIGLSLQVRMVI